MLTNTPAGDQPAASSVDGKVPLPIDPASGLPKISTEDGDLHKVTGQINDVIMECHEAVPIYRQGDQLVRVVKEDDGSISVVNVIADTLRAILASIIYFFVEIDGEDVQMHPPPAFVRNVLAQPDKPFPILNAVASAPFFTRDGSLAAGDGYFQDSGMLLALAAGETAPNVPDEPTDEDVAEARNLILDEMLCDFPFVDAADRAHALAAFIAPVIRPMVNGSAPLFLISKEAPGTGAGMMIDLITLVSVGGSAAVMTEGAQEEEFRKRITAKLRTGPRIIVIDNVRRRLDCSALAAALTAHKWEDRVIGTSNIARLSTRSVTWVATGNKVQTSLEIARRTLLIGLDAGMLQPWRRMQFRHQNLIAWATENRARLRRAVLVLVQSWISRGRPLAPGQSRLGSFENWCDIVGGVLHVAGVPGFLGNTDRLYGAADPQGNAIATFSNLWWAAHGSTPVGVTKLLEIAREAELDLGAGPDKAISTRFGIRLKRMAGQRLNAGDGTSLTITEAGVISGAKQWALV